MIMDDSLRAMCADRDTWCASMSYAGRTRSGETRIDVFEENEQLLALVKGLLHILQGCPVAQGNQGRHERISLSTPFSQCDGEWCVVGRAGHAKHKLKDWEKNILMNGEHQFVPGTSAKAARVLCL